MGKRPKRKIVLFLVEGKSDREALQLAYSAKTEHSLRMSGALFR